MRIVSWNVNSLRAREARVAAYLDAQRPEVVCLQETKVQDDQFPRELFESRGYAVEVFGEKTYNGVAIASRLPLSDVWRGLPDDGPEAQKRLIGAEVGGLRVIDVYVPNGGELGTERFAYKLAWLRRLRDLLDRRCRPGDPVVVCGDFNVAPDDRDVHDPEKWRGQLLFSDDEHAALAGLQRFGLEDLLRTFDAEGGRFTWWDYRAGAFHRNWGLRIDLFLGTAAARARCRGVSIDRDQRKGEKPSDHVPVVADFDGP